MTRDHVYYLSAEQALEFGIIDEIRSISANGVFHVADQHQPRRTAAPGIRLVVLDQDPADDVHV